MKNFLKRGVNKIPQEQSEKDRQLVIAMNEGNEKMALKLIKANANAEIADENGNTTLHWAAIKGNSKILFTLLDKGAEKDSTNNEGRTAMHCAAIEGHTKIINALIDYKANIDMVDTEYGSTALHYATNYGHTETVNALLNKGANKNITNNFGRTAQSYADSKVKKIFKKYMIADMINLENCEAHAVLNDLMQTPSKNSNRLFFNRKNGRNKQKSRINKNGVFC